MDTSTAPTTPSPLAAPKAVASASKVAPRPAKPAPGMFYLPGFDQPLPIEAKYTLVIALEELEAIPPKHFAANERQGLEEAFDHVLNRLAVRGADDYTAFLSRRLLAAIRHQAKVCASRAHRQDIRNEADRRVQDAERLARKAKREASREFEYKGDGTQEDVARANALPVSVEPEIMESKPGPKARRAQHQAVKKQVAAKRDTELDTLTKGIARNGRGRRAA